MLLSDDFSYYASTKLVTATFTDAKRKPSSHCDWVNQSNNKLKVVNQALPFLRLQEASAPVYVSCTEVRTVDDSFEEWKYDGHLHL